MVSGYIFSSHCETQTCSLTDFMFRYLKADDGLHVVQKVADLSQVRQFKSQLSQSLVVGFSYLVSGQVL